MTVVVAVVAVSKTPSSCLCSVSHFMLRSDGGGSEWGRGKSTYYSSFSTVKDTHILIKLNTHIHIKEKMW